MGDKAPLAWGLALLQAGSIFQRSQFCPMLDWDVPISLGEVFLFLTPGGHELEQSHQPTCESPHGDSHCRKAPTSRRERSHSPRR